MWRWNSLKENHAGVNFHAPFPMTAQEYQVVTTLARYSVDLRGQKRTKSRLLSWTPTASWCFVAMLLVEFLLCTTSGAAQVGRRTAATLSLSVYVVPIVAAIPVGRSFRARLYQANLMPAINLSIRNSEYLKSIRPLSESTWAGTVQGPEKGPQPPAYLPDSQDNASGEKSSRTPSGPPSANPGYEEIMLHSITYVAE
jgi:hypothetical protein